MYYLLLIAVLASCEKSSKVITVDTLDKNIEINNRITNYNSVPFSGVLQTSNDSGDILYYAEYFEGKKNGVERKFFPNGDLAEERFYTKGKKTGIHRAWWKKNQRRFLFRFNSTGAYHGNCKVWYDSGQLRMNFNYVNGKEKGAQKLWDTIGKITSNYVVKKGQRFGLIGSIKCKPVVSLD